MRKLLIFLLIVILSSVSVCADLIIPPNDEFWEENQALCTPHRQYYITVENTVLVDNPESQNKIETIGKNEYLYIEYLYRDKNHDVWGLQSLYDESFWVKLDTLERLESYHLFNEEHRYELVEEFIEIPLYENKWLVCYQYPNSFRISSAPNADFSDSMTVFETWTDENGIKWGNLGKYAGWIRLDQLYSDQKPAIAEQYEPYQLYSNPISNSYVICALVITSCTLTAVLSFALYRKRRIHETN